VRVALQKLPGVESVNVSLERASTEIQLRPGNSITLEQVRSIIRNNGFTTKETTVTVAGRVIERHGAPALDVTGTNTVMLIVPDPKQPAIFKQIEDRLRATGAGVIRITGAVESRPDSPDRIAAAGISEDR
jgi:hypothetical protein